MHNKVSWDDYRYFLNVARLGPLKAAGEALKVNHSTVLRRVNALEKKLSARLFERFKTGYVLTQSGQDMFSHIQEWRPCFHPFIRNASLFLLCTTLRTIHAF